MDRRTFLAATALGLSGCGGGNGGATTPNVPAPLPPSSLPFATGWIQMPVEDYRNIPEAGEGNFPIMGGFDRFDLSDIDFLAKAGFPKLLPASDPQGQGAQPSCTAWAVGFAAATATMRYAGTTLDTPISPADLFAKMLRVAPRACSDGATISLAMETLVQHGAATLAYAPYSDRQCGISSSAPGHTLDGYSRIAASDSLSIRGAVQMMQPVSFGMAVNGNFQNLTANLPVYVPDGSGGGHAMSVIGYDDAMQRYKVINSWGQQWAANGTFWISYADFARYASDVCIPYLRRSADNELFAKSTSNPASSITAQHMKGRRYGVGGTGRYGVGIEMGWSAPLDINLAAISVLDSSQSVVFTQEFNVRQIARGIRIGTRITDMAASSMVYLSSMIRGVDGTGAPLTLTTFTKSASR